MTTAGLGSAHFDADAPPSVRLGTTPVTPLDVDAVAFGHAEVLIEDDTYTRLDSSRAVVESALALGVPAYGVNRGLGPARDQVVPIELIEDFQEFVITSHAAAVGTPLSPSEARAIVFARLAVMSQGGSGASRELFDGLLALLQKDVVPVIPTSGSVGSADLAHLAAIGSVLIGRGRAYAQDGVTIVPGGEALAAAGLEPARLRAKDGLALVGANSASIGLSALLHQDLEATAYAADVIAAYTVEALASNLSPFSEEVVEARPLPGQVRSAARVRQALEGGDLEAGRVLTRSLQDPLSIRTVPQVHGVFLEQIRHLEDVLLVELNSPSENPLINSETRTISSNGNFAVLALAINLESIRLAIAHVAIIAERRINMMVQHIRSTFSLADQIRTANKRGGYLAPVIIANTASSITARIKHLSNPVTVMGTTVGDGVEDHNSQAYLASRFTSEALDYLRQLQAIEVLLATDVLAYAEAEAGGTRVLSEEISSLRDVTRAVVRELGQDAATDLVIEELAELIPEVLADYHHAIPAAMPTPISGFEHDPQQ